MEDLPEHLKNATTDEKMDWFYAQAEAQMMKWAKAWNAMWANEILEGKPGGVSKFLEGLK